MDKLASIETFITVADCQSFSGAAEQLRMSKAMVSKHVQSLEQLLGTRLFARTTRHLRLTDAGTPTSPAAGECWRNSRRWNTRSGSSATHRTAC